jgi:glycosyltransferase involved in cell wall biosynthesis
VKRSLHIGIDAANIRVGGGVTHLSQMLAAANPENAGVSRVTIWACPETLSALPDRPWLVRRSPRWVQASLLYRVLGQQWVLPHELKIEGCDALFSSGGTLPRHCPIPAVTMSQNMLPFEPDQARLFGRFSLMRLKMKLLQISQGRSLRQAEGVIFLTRYAQGAVTAALGGICGETALIPHGVEKRFFLPPRPVRALKNCSEEHPFQLLYVSIQMPYKHQIEVAKAVSRLRAEGFPIEIHFVGAPWGWYGDLVRKTCRSLDPAGKFLHLLGATPFGALHTFYGEADAFLFASSCENLPNILIEAMAAGLPMLSSDCGPMPEVLGAAGVYFNPYSVDAIACAIKSFVVDENRRGDLAALAFEVAKEYSWERCATDTFAFVADIARQRKA